MNDYRQNHEMLVQQELALIEEGLGRIARVLERLEKEGVRVTIKR